MKSRVKSRGHSAGVLVLLLWAVPLLGMAAPLPSSPSGGAGNVSAGADIRDIHGPLWIPAWWRPWLIGLAAVAAGGAAVGIGLLIARRKRRPLTPEQRALHRLDEAEPLAQAGDSRSYAEAASDAVRSYLEEGFGLPASHRTTDEFFAELVVQQPVQLKAHTLALNRFLGACDLAKFSLFGMAREDLASLNQLARQFVIATAHPKAARTT